MPLPFDSTWLVSRARVPFATVTAPVKSAAPPRRVVPPPACTRLPLPIRPVTERLSERSTVSVPFAVIVPRTDPPAPPLPSVRPAPCAMVVALLAFAPVRVSVPPAMTSVPPLLSPITPENMPPLLMVSILPLRMKLPAPERLPMVSSEPNSSAVPAAPMISADPSLIALPLKRRSRPLVTVVEPV